MTKPFVSVIIVNYNGRNLLEETLPSVFSQNYPHECFEVIVVDNNSEDDSIPFIKKKYPQVILVEASTNLGFTGGNNLGLSCARGKCIVMLNSDVVVDANWLSELVNAAKPRNVGIVASRLRYNLPFLELSLVSDAYPQSLIDRSINHSPVGVMIEEIVCETDNLTQAVIYQEGFYDKSGKDLITRRTNGKARLLLPFNALAKQQRYILTLHGLESKEVPALNTALNFGPYCLFEGKLEAYEVKQLQLVIRRARAVPHFVWLIQNAGNFVLCSGYSKDRGSVSVKADGAFKQSYEEESSYFLSPQELLSACGASCLIKREVINQVEFLDGYYFMYYEDVEFCLRAWRAGWKIVYAPQSIGYHKHRATTGTDDSGFFLEHVERNHLAMMLTHFPLATFMWEFVFFILRLVGSGCLSFIMQFRDLGLSHKYKVRYTGRKTALAYLLRSWIRLFKSRLELQRRWPINYKKLTRYLY